MPGIHVFDRMKTWMAGTSSEAALRALPGHDGAMCRPSLYKDESNARYHYFRIHRCGPVMDRRGALSPHHAARIPADARNA
jgi:hypothetical protein